MKIIIANDLHLSDKPPRWRTDSYTDDILKKLWQICGMARDMDAVLVLSGDVFHLPAPAKTSHWLVSEVAEQLSIPKCVRIVPGNHDLAGGRIEAIGRSPLSVLCQLPNISILNGWEMWPEEEDPKETPFTVVGIPWHYDMTAKSFLANFAGREPFLTIAHAPISPLDLPYDIVRATDIAGPSSIIVYGHMHKPEQVYQIGKTLFVNPGSISRGSLTDDDLLRTPQVALLDTAKQTINYIPLTIARPPVEVFKLSLSEAQKSTEKDVSEFVEQLEEQSVTRITFEDLRDRVTKAAEPGIVEEAIDILEAVHTI